MSKTQEALKLALEALEKCDSALAEELAAWDIDPPLHHVLEASNACGSAITAIREALAEQPAQQINPETRTKDGMKHSPNYVAGYNDGLKAAQQQEPVGRWMGDCIEWTENPYKFRKGQPLYTSPPASKPWVGLTDEEIEDAWPFVWRKHESVRHFAIYHAIEAKLKEKNA